MSSSGQSFSGTRGRRIVIRLRDRFGDPLRAGSIEISINGRFRGSIFTGSPAASESVIEIESSTAVVSVKAEANDGTVLRADLPPGVDDYQFDFQTAPLIKANLPPTAHCPDGTTGSPCVTCSDGIDTWRICT